MMDNVGVYRDEALLTGGARQGPRAPPALRQGRVADKRLGLQHRPARGARGRLPARLRRDHGRRRARPQGEPRRPRPRGLPERDDVELPDPQPGDPGGRRPDAQPTSRSRSPSSSRSRGPTDAGNTMQVDLRILRYDPERDTKPHWESLPGRVRPEVDRVLDLLHRVKYEQDGTLTFRRSCAHGVCGSDAMLINGRNRLACKVRSSSSASAGSPSRRCPGCRSSRTSSSTWTGSSTSSGASSRTSSRDAAAGRERLQSPEDRALRRHDQVHPVRRLHDVMPVVLGAAVVRRAGRDRQRPPVHLRLARRGRPTSGSRSSPTRTACGAAGRSSTARTPARAASTSPRRSSRSARRSWSAA